MALLCPPPPEDMRTPTPRVDTSTLQLRLSQSLIKNLEEGEMCPRFYLEYHLLRLRPIAPSSQMQRMGQHFEFLTLGNASKDGNIVFAEQTSRGQKSADQKRMEEQAYRFKRVLDDYGLQVVLPEGYDTPGITLQAPLPNAPDVLFEGTWDAPLLEVATGANIIMDLKLTASLKSQYGGHGKPGWGNYMAMDHIQAIAYLWLAHTLLDTSWRFMYAIFECGPAKDYQLIEVEASTLQTQEFLKRAHLAAHTLEQWKEQDFPEAGTPSCCRRCIHRDTCPSATLVKPILKFKSF